MAALERTFAQTGQFETGGYRTSDESLGSAFDTWDEYAVVVAEEAVAGVAASALLTSTGAGAQAGDTVTLGTETYAFQDTLTTLVQASGVLTSDGAGPDNDDTVTIEDNVYTFKTALTAAGATPQEVLIGVSAATALTNLGAAINLGAGAGTTYGTGTALNNEVTAGAVDGLTLPLEAWEGNPSYVGAGGNAIATTTTGTKLTFGHETLEGGYSLVPFEVLHGGNAANALDNLKSAVNASAGAGTAYGTGTTANADIDATTNTDTTQLFVAKVAGEAGNALEATTVGANLNFGAEGFDGGEDAE